MITGLVRLYVCFDFGAAVEIVIIEFGDYSEIVPLETAESISDMDKLPLAGAVIGFGPVHRCDYVDIAFGGLVNLKIPHGLTESPHGFTVKEKRGFRFRCFLDVIDCWLHW